MKGKRIAFLLLTTLCTVLSFSGCHKKQAETKEIQESAVHEPVTIMDGQRDYAALIRQVKEKYPEINIQILPYRGRNMSAFMKQQLETGRMPDIYSSTQAWDSELQKEHLVDLSQYAVTSLYNPARLGKYTFDGAIYLLPYDYSIQGILYNSSLFERLGIPLPENFIQLRDETIPALKKAGVKVSNCLMDLPASAFQDFFNTTSYFMNSLSGRKWRKEFTDLGSQVFASDNEDVLACADYFQQWIDCGMLNGDHAGKSNNTVIEDFRKGNTAFLVGQVNQFYQNDDNTGDQYKILPFLSPDGKQNFYITTPGRVYGLNKELEKAGNEQKLEDALHVLEVLSSNETYRDMFGATPTNMCSIANFDVTEESPFFEAVQKISKGYSMDLLYVGWENYLVPFGEAVRDWICGKTSAKEALGILDDTKRQVQEKGTTYYATVTEEMDTVQAAQLSGQIFMEATGADAALISYNVYSPDFHAILGNSNGANGKILEGKMSDENITIFLPTGWYDTLLTASLTGEKVKRMAKEGCDVRGNGFHFPYVLLTADGKPLEDAKTYTVVICGYTKSEKEALGLTDTDIVGLDAAKEYLKKRGTISLQTLDMSLLQSVGTKTSE